MRAGGEWLGSIWAVVDERRRPTLVAELRADRLGRGAAPAAPARAGRPHPRGSAADRLRASLSGPRQPAPATWLPPGPWRVGRPRRPDGDPGRRLDLWESLCRRRGWRQPLLADLEGRVYAVVRADGEDPGTWAWLAAVVRDARAEGLDLTARAGRVAGRRRPTWGGPATRRSRPSSSPGPADVSASHEQLWAEVTVARAARSVGDASLGPVALLVAHDAEHRTDHVRTLAAWLDHPGEPSRAARQLHVHPNTLRYRMARIADTAGLDLTDPVVRLARAAPARGRTGARSRSTCLGWRMSGRGVLGIVQAGGQGSRMDVLTRERAKPALPFAGCYQLIDFALSAMTHARVDDVWVSVQYLAGSLDPYLAGGRPWDLDRTRGGYRRVVPEEGDGDAESGFSQGNADDLLLLRRQIEDLGPDHIVVSSADHVFATDLDAVLTRHRERGSDCTVVVAEVTKAEAKHNAVVVADASGLVRSVDYKPSAPRATTVATEVFVYRTDVLVTTLDRLRAELGLPRRARGRWPGRLRRAPAAPARRRRQGPRRPRRLLLARRGPAGDLPRGTP